MSRRSVAVVTLGFMVGATAGWLAGAVLSPAYVSTASIVLTPLPGNAYARGSNASLTNLETEAQLALSDGVVGQVAASGTGPSDVDTIRSRTSVSAVEGAEVVQIRYRAPAEATSTAVARSLADATLDARRQLAERAKDDQVTLISTLIRTTRSDLRAATSSYRVEALSRRLASLEDQLDAARGQDTRPGDLVSLSVRHDRRLLPRVGLTVVGGLLGMAAGALVVSATRRRRLSAPRLW